MDTRDHRLVNEQLINLLRSIDRPGDYCVGDRLYVPMPHVTVDGVGELSFPVPEAQIDKLIEGAERAPYGKGTKTLTDTSVRDCWQIDAKRVRVAGRPWSSTFKKIMERVSIGLGLTDGKLGAQLYKLLIYREGGFFAAHRDTEKVSGMIATLSLSLPTPGEGGELVVSHQGETAVFDMSAKEPSELAFAAFYADCLHEARPVTRGHRISLVYNLFVRSGKAWNGAPNYSKLTEQIATCLANWHSQGKAEKLVWLLNHWYSEDGLSFDTLKGIDAAVAQVLGRAAERAGCSIYAAVLHIEEIGDPEIEWGADGWGNVEPITGSTLEEVHERFEYLENWVAPDGSCPTFGKLSLGAGEIQPPDILADADPDEELLEEYQGNYGPTLELIYRFAALVIWPKVKTVSVLSAGDIKHAVSWVAAHRDQESEAEMRRMLTTLEEVWPEGNYGSGDNKRAEMLQLLAETGNTDIAVRFLDRTLINQFDGSENESLAGLIPLVGPKLANNFLQGLVEKYLPQRPKEILSLLTQIERNPDNVGADWRDMERAAVRTAIAGLRASLEAATEALAALTPRRTAHGLVCSGSPKMLKTLSMDPEAIRNLFVLTWHLGLTEEAIQAARIIADFPKVVTPERMLPAALARLYEEVGLASTQAYRILWRQATDSLLERSSTPPCDPADWAIRADFPCACELSAELQTFCLHPTTHVKRFKVVKARRRHLRDIIDDHKLDIDYETDRRGRPYTLVCTKNRDSHKQRLNEYAEDVQRIGLLPALVPQGNRNISEGERVRRLAAAHVASQRK